LDGSKKKKLVEVHKFKDVPRFRVKRKEVAVCEGEENLADVTRGANAYHSGFR
jgi:hypothetical protein